MFSSEAQERAGRLPWVWGAPVAAEALAVTEPMGGREVRRATRAVVTGAEPSALFLWLCQLRRAPYSYDWIDNFGRRSPRQADPEMQDLAIGQEFMTIFTLTAYEPGRALTLRMNPGWPRRVFGDLAVTYRITQVGRSLSQLNVVLWLPLSGHGFGRLRRYLLAWGDVLMMRKQLHVLRRLAEHEPFAGAPLAYHKRRGS